MPMTMEKLKNLRKQKGITQQYLANIIATDVSNYSRKENGEVKIYDEEWEKLAQALDVNVEDIKENRTGQIQNNENPTLNDNSSINYNQYCSIPEYLLENQQEYIKLLKEQIEALKEENKKIRSRKSGL